MNHTVDNVYPAPVLQKRPVLPLATLGSALLHGAVIAGLLFFTGRQAERKPKEQPLQIELSGMLSERQVQAKQQASAPVEHKTDAPQKVQPPTKTEHHALVKAPAVHHHAVMKAAKTVARPSPVKQAFAEHQPLSAPPPVPAHPAPQAPVSPSEHASTDALQAKENQQQQRIQSPDMKALMNVYVRELVRRVQQNLIYPDDARKDSLSGIPVIHFTLNKDGTLLSGSLSVKKSSGFDILDQYAMQAVRESAPFSPPPKMMSVSISISFAQKI